MGQCRSGKGRSCFCSSLAGDDGGLGSGKKKIGKIGGLFQKWREGVEVESERTIKGELRVLSGKLG